MWRNRTAWRLSFTVILLMLVGPTIPESSAGPLDDLTPSSQSLPANVRLIVFTPSFKVFGIRRPPPLAKTEKPAPPPSSPNSVDKLIQLLIKKGVVTEEEWRKANQP
ncbi:MAG: hypothetical protein ABI980_08540 [Nitrospirota bacterium]|jgi:hypothetical protein